MSIQDVFGETLREIRVESKLSQEQLGILSGLHRTYISSVEREQRNVSLQNVFAIAQALGCDPRDLLTPVSATPDL